MATHNRSMRLLIVTPRYAPFVGGIENHVREVGTRLAQAGIDVTVLTTDPSGRLPREEVSEGLRVRRVRAWPAKRDYYFAPGLWRVITREQWDIIHCQGYHTLVPPLAMLAALRAKVPYVVTFHGGGHSSQLRNAIRGIQRKLLRPLLARARRLVAVANFEIALFGQQLHLPKERFVLIPNGADLGNVTDAAPITTDGPLILSVGRLERYKGHHRVLEALPTLLEQRPDVRLRIVGTGPYEADLRRQAQKLGVAHRVEIGGIPPSQRQAMASLLMSASLVTLLSEYETHPIAVMEALALGRPVLVADTSGLSELAERGLVRAIPLESTPRQIAAAIQGQLQQPLVPPMVEWPTWDGCAMALKELYHEEMGVPACVS
jgi:glycosyltransferase involved in cell wall biosynthesis